MTPLFIFSLPRSGSTLVQRILASDPQISTANEPWILLPLIYARRGHGIAADYDHGVMTQAIDGFCNILPNGAEDFDEAIRNFAISLYEKQGTGQYFLDKTPRYASIAPEICKVFPDAKIIFLWRNPLAIMASMIETWGAGRWNLFRYQVDIFDGIEGLLRARKAAGSDCIDIVYENFVVAPEEALSKIEKDLGIDFSDHILDDFKQTELHGKLGDPTRGSKYQEISDHSIRAWQSSVKNPLRRWWFRNYLRNLGDENLILMGQNLTQLLAELDAAPVSGKYLVSDGFLMVYGYFYRLLNLPLLRRRFAFKKLGGALR